MIVREPAVAGGFYPADAEVLGAMTLRFMEAAPKPPAGQLRALIAPHAGYPYCGPVAGAAFGLLCDAGAYRRVLQLGPSHFMQFDGLALSPADAWRTPLGDVPVAAPPPLPEAQLISPNAAAHQPEHCLEVQLPFLQTALPEFTLTPLLTGDVDPAEAAAALELQLDDDVLVVVSTDLSHFRPERQAREIDGLSNDAIARLDLASFTAGGDACGKTAVQTLMHLALRRGWRPQLLSYATSADASGDRSRVVGYSAFAFTEGTA